MGDVEQDAQVIPFPRRKPSCLICVHALLGEMTYCEAFDEVIENESVVARDCFNYHEDRRKS